METLMMKMRNLLLPLVVACLALTGCMTTPGDGQWYNNRNDEIEFAGFVPGPHAIVTIEVFRRSINGSPEGWAFFTQAASVADPLFPDPTDPDVKWYHWSAKARAGTDLSIWRSRSGGHGNPGYEARFRAYIGDVSQPTLLSTFRQGFSRCLNGDQQNMCGGPRPQNFEQLIAACGNGAKTEIKINAFD
jgi:hypothetical protein